MRGKVAGLGGVAVVLFLAGAATVFAQGGTGPVILQNPLGSSCNDLSCPVDAVMNFLFTIAIPLSGILLLVGGFQIMTAAGNPEKVSTGRKTLLYAVIGFAIILVSGSVAAIIKNTFGGP